jgi:ribosomal protein L37E
MEAVRRDVDRHILDLLESTTFRFADFFETGRGGCRLLRLTTRQLAQATRWLAQLVAPVAEHVARLLHEHAGNAVVQPTPLTQTNRRPDRARRHQRPTPSAATVRPPKPERRCKRCGGQLPHRDRKYCDDCVSLAERDRYQAFAAAGRARKDELAAAGRDPSPRGTAAARRSATQAQRHLELRDRKASMTDPPTDPDWFRRDVVPRLHDVPLTTLARATGLTPGYLSQIRLGLKTPHRRHWQKVAAAVTEKTSAYRKVSRRLVARFT